MTFRVRPQESDPHRPGHFAAPVVEFPDLTGTLYGGTVGGEARVVLDDQTRYRVWLTASGVQLDEAPFTSALGKRIHETICEDCWREWMAMSIKVINELRLNPATPEGSRIYDHHMSEFLGLEIDEG